MTMKNFLIETIFDENATTVDLLKVAAVLAVLIYVVFALLRPILTMVLRGPLKDAIWKLTEREFNRSDKIAEQELFGITTKEEYAEMVFSFLPESILISSQHLVGGLFVLPAVFGMGFSPEFRNSLACLAILVEMGWEIQDFCKMLSYRLFMGKAGAAKCPTIVIILFSLHHSLTCGLGIPAIQHYRDLPILHRLIFNLQFAGGITFLVPEYCRMLDVTKRNELRQFVFLSLFMFMFVLWTRVFDWFYIVYKLLERFHADENWSFLYGGCVIFPLFSIFNFVFGVIPLYLRLTKFAEKLIEFDALPDDATEAKRRSTIYDLTVAAGELASTEVMFEDLIMSLFEERQIQRRHSVSMAVISREAAMAAAAKEISYRRTRPHRHSMVAWGDMPSTKLERAKNKSD